MKLVETTADLATAIEALAGAARLYIDTEFESGRDGTRLALLQIADEREAYLFDAVRLPSLRALAPVLDREWVVHAGRQDVALIVEATGVDLPPRVLDTQVAWALQGPEFNVSLAYLAYRALGVRMPKDRQADRWLERPLSPRQLEYAAADVETLRALYAPLTAKIDVAAAWAASAELFVPRDEELSFDDFRNAWQLDAAGQAVLRDLLTSGLDAKTLFAVATRLPRTAQELADVRGFPRAWTAQQKQQLVARIDAVARSPAGHVEMEPPPYTTWPRVHADGLCALASEQVGVAPDLLFPGWLRRRVVVEGTAAWRGTWREAIVDAAWDEVVARLRRV